MLWDDLAWVLACVFPFIPLLPAVLPTNMKVVSVDGEYSEIAETSCGTSVFAVGSTIYELRDVTLAPREFGEFEVISMMADDGSCSFARTDNAPDCYR